MRHPVVAQIIQAYEKNNKSIPKQLGKEWKYLLKKVLTKLGDRLGKAYLPILLAVFLFFYLWLCLAVSIRKE